MSHPATWGSGLPGSTADPDLPSPVDGWPQQRPPRRPVREQVAPTLRGFRTRHLPAGLLLYGSGRTGSTLLGTLVGSHPDVVFLDEMLRLQVRSPLRYLDGLRVPLAGQHCSVHVKRYHLTHLQGVEDPRRWLEAAVGHGWRLVHLQRHNLLRHCLSGFQLTHAGVSHTRADDGFRPDRIRIDPTLLLAWMGERERILRDEVTDLRELPHVTVVYEDDLLPGAAAWAATTDRVFDHLGVPRAEVTTPLRKTNTGRLSDLLANADEVVGAVATSRWAHLLDDESV